MKQKSFLQKKRRLLFIGAITLFNPCVNIVDIIPDVIGWVLIAIALISCSVADTELGECRRYAHLMIGVSAAKLVLSPLAAVSSVDDDRLLATFCFAVAECVFTLMFSSRFLNELDYLTGRYASESTHILCVETTDFCRLFLQLKIWLPLLPELTSLAADQSHADDINSLEWSAIAEMKSFITVLAVLIMLVLGIIYLIKITRLYKAIKNDKDYNAVLDKKYAENASRDIYRSYRGRLKAACIVAALGAMCFVDLYISQKPVITPFLGMILIGIFGIVSGEKKQFARVLKSLAIALPFEIAAMLIRISLPTDIVDVVQMDMTTALTGLAAATLSAVAWLCFAYSFARDAYAFTKGLAGLRHNFKSPVICFVIMLVIRGTAMILPYLKPWTVTPYFAVCAVAVITFTNALAAVYEAATINKKAE